MKRLVFIVCFVVLSVSGFSAPQQCSWNTTGIPDNLKSNAFAVIRQDSTVVECKDCNTMFSSHVVAITVLNDNGSDFADFSCYTNRNSSLKKFRCTVYDAAGAVKRKLTKNELDVSQYSESMADDYTHYSLEISYPIYPYTVVYEYEKVYSNGYISIPVYSPAYSAGVSLEHSFYTLITPTGYEYKYKSVNCDVVPECRTTASGGRAATWRMDEIPARKSDRYMPDYYELTPRVYFAPHEFVYYKFRGSAVSWEDYGRWQWNLMEGRDVLPEKLIHEVHELTDTITTKRGKIKALYDYLGRTTRYVSIQLGIGGLQPMTAEEVYRNKFGDCKALSNYMKAMLKECGIESNYVEIHTRNRHIFRDLVSPVQTNHAILKVPDEDGDLWLECTNTDVPMGFPHGSIAGHDAVVYADGTAHIETVPINRDEDNAIVSEATISFGASDSTYVKINEVFEGMCSDRFAGIRKLKKKDLVSLARNRVNLSLATVDNVGVAEYLSPQQQPAVRLTYDILAMKYANMSGGRVFIPLTPFAISSVKLNKMRETDIYIKTGYVWRQKIDIRLPDGYAIESVPTSINVNNDFGSGSLEIAASDGAITVNIERRYNSGTYSASDADKFGELLNFLPRIANGSIILKKVPTE